MSFFNQYPYININDLNLDFILNAIKEMRNEVTNFVSINAIKYADPIQWNITSQYEKNTIVIDPQTGTAYISVAPVPSGVALTREEYWTVVFDLGSFVTRAAKNFTTRYEQDTTTTATFNSVAGDWLVWGDTLYVANVNITAGDSYVVDGNIRRITVEEVKNTIMQLIADNYDAIVAMIGDLNDLTTTAKNNIVAAINELVSADGALSDRIDDEVQARQDADGALSDRIDDEVQARQDAGGALSDRIDDEVQARQDADDTLQGNIDAVASKIEDITPNEYAHVVFLFDSLGENVTPNISTLIPEHMRLDSDNYLTLVQGGCGFTNACPYQYLTVLQNAAAQILTKFGDADKVTQIIVQGGSNDAGYDYNIANIRSAIDTFALYCNTTYPKAKIKLLFTGWTHTDANGFVPSRNTLLAFNEITRYGGAVIDCTPVRHLRSFFVDLAHPTTDGQEEIAKFATNILLGGISDAHYEIVETLTATTGITYGGTGTPKVRQRLDNNQVSCNWVIDDLYYIQFTGATSDASGNCTNYLIGTIPDWIIGDNQQGTTKFTVSMGVGGFPEGVRVCPVTFTIAGGNIYAAVMSLDTNSTIRTLNFSSTQIGIFDIYSC